MVKYFHKKEKAIQFTVAIKGNTQEYALSLLNIFNHCRVYPGDFYKVENNSENIVYVTCNPRSKNECREYLEDFGEVRYEEEINWFVIKAEYDKSGWEELFGDDCEQDFTVEIE